MRRRDHAAIVREKDDTIRLLTSLLKEAHDRMMYLTGSTWTPPPAVVPPSEEPMPDFTWAPEREVDAFVDNGN